MKTVEIINGARTSFGPRNPETELAASVLTLGAKKQLVVPVKYNQLPSHVEDDVTGASLPANALITAVYSTAAIEDFTTGTSYDVKLVKDDGSPVITVATIDTAEMNSGAEATVTNAQVGDISEPAYVELEETGSFDAGQGALVIEYIEQIQLF